MSGTILNAFTIIFGSLIGMLVGNRLPKNIQESVVTGLGCVTLVVAVDNALKSGNIIIPLLSLIIGVIIGELLDIDGAFKRFGGWLQTRTARPTTDSADAAAIARARFINGFVTASLLFCIGPMAILGPVRNGIDGSDIQILAIKSSLDFFGAIAFASSLGIGVMFSVIPTLLIQGVFVIVGVALGGVLIASGGLDASNPYIRELTATGGLTLIGIALTLLDVKRPRVSNFLPALVIAPLLILIATLLHIPYYPVIK